MMQRAAEVVPAVGSDHGAPSGSSAADRLLAQQLLAILGRLGATIHAALVARVDPAIVENVDVLVLATLDVEGSLRPTRIRQLTGMSSSGVTTLLDRLERHGLVVREIGAVPGDRRGTRVVLTPEGRRVAAALADGLVSRMGAVRAALAELRSVTGD